MGYADRPETLLTPKYGCRGSQRLKYEYIKVAMYCFVANIQLTLTVKSFSSLGNSTSFVLTQSRTCSACLQLARHPQVFVLRRISKKKERKNKGKMELRTAAKRRSYGRSVGQQTHPSDRFSRVSWSANRYDQRFRRACSARETRGCRAPTISMVKRGTWKWRGDCHLAVCVNQL